jgi:hypothetical protein
MNWEFFCEYWTHGLKLTWAVFSVITNTCGWFWSRHKPYWLRVLFLNNAQVSGQFAAISQHHFDLLLVIWFWYNSSDLQQFLLILERGYIAKAGYMLNVYLNRELDSWTTTKVLDFFCGVLCIFLWCLLRESLSHIDSNFMTRSYNAYPYSNVILPYHFSATTLNL